MSEKKFTVRPRIEVSMTQQDIDDIMFTALEGGINYWCRGTQVIGEFLGEYGSEQISRGGALLLWDTESAERWELNLEKFLNGVTLYFENNSHVQVEDGCIDTSCIDANCADSIIQFALFGKLVFG